MSRNKEFAEESTKPVFEAGKVYVNMKNVSMVQCLGEYTHIILTNGQDHKFKTEQLVVLE